MINNKILVEYAKKAAAEKWGYVWGTFGQVLTQALYDQKVKQYPSEVGGYANFIRSNWFGRKVTDCVGLIKGAYWSESGTLVYNPKTDISADSMYSLAQEKGEISTIPEIEGLCVWKKGHIGVYIRGGQVIEAHGTKYGVIQTPLTGSGSTPWTHWLKCPYIKYEKAEETWQEIVINAADNDESWIQAIIDVSNMAKAANNIGAMKVLEFLPTLIVKIHNNAK
ncbi:hypothetical protein [Petroclostridium sp. X23]|uniref:hypothetical protein n=1 Tax=Petroclostridium sp. X23 TaxID=3045146 RepID=UPI0024ACA905|nr:hypothetical protein [Petroclostridium sp. X23]WHH58493.1 hypothetical protein QKW49_22270 [Petroclostridium sp. X23]